MCAAHLELMPANALFSCILGDNNIVFFHLYTNENTFRINYYNCMIFAFLHYPRAFSKDNNTYRSPLLFIQTEIHRLIIA